MEVKKSLHPKTPVTLFCNLFPYELQSLKNKILFRQLSFTTNLSKLDLVILFKLETFAVFLRRRADRHPAQLYVFVKIEDSPVLFRSSINRLKFQLFQKKKFSTKVKVLKQVCCQRKIDDFKRRGRKKMNILQHNATSCNDLKRLLLKV